MISKINLNSLKNNHNKIRIKFKEGFLLKVLKLASNSEKPHRNKKFCDAMGEKFNLKIKASPNMITWIRFNKFIPLEKLILLEKMTELGWDEFEKNSISLKSVSGAKAFITFPLKLDEKLGSIVGHILGDGSIDKKYLQVFYSNSDKNLLKEFSKNMEEIFGILPRIWMQKTSTFEGTTRWEKRLENIDELKQKRNGGLFYPSICGILLNSIFENFAIGEEKFITKEIVNTNKKFKKGLIRAFYDDEGSVGSKSIRLFQDRKEILLHFKRLLEEFEIITKDVKVYKKREKERYYLDIHRKSNLIKFRDNIGFTSPKKSSKLKDICIIKRPTLSK